MTSAMFYSPGVAKKTAKDLYDRAQRMYRREPNWRVTRAALLSAMDAHQFADALGSGANEQERTYAVRMIESAQRAVADAESYFPSKEKA